MHRINERAKKKYKKNAKKSIKAINAKAPTLSSQAALKHFIHKLSVATAGVIDGRQTEIHGEFKFYTNKQIMKLLKDKSRLY